MLKNLNEKVISISVILFVSLILSLYILEDIRYGIIPFVIILYFTHVSILLLRKSYNNTETPVEIRYQKKFKIFFLPTINYEGIKISKDIFETSLWVFKIQIVPLSICIIEVLKFLVKRDIITQNQLSESITLILVSSILGLLIKFKDLIWLGQIFFKNRDALYVKVENKKLEFCKDINFKNKHRDIVLYEISYSKYSVIDLEREVIYLESKMKRTTEPKFYDKYFIPIAIIVFGTIIGFVNSIFSIILSSDDGFSSLDRIFKYYFLYILLFSSIFIFITSARHFMKPEFPDLLHMRLQVVKTELLRRNNIE
ncbi:hypothetical protein [Senegalia massiliensis]|uniref:Uncharacterized protein n=1 Tax=Senegalia massiliensis TaxID=1720316 RepID=A0A845QVS5_9CLOT|nr:hypothetical protein [Senegalia massiliensis]NBI05238.1 hypothetical protein [Senegalia massiliensis]